MVVGRLTPSHSAFRHKTCLGILRGLFGSSLYEFRVALHVLNELEEFRKFVDLLIRDIQGYFVRELYDCHVVFTPLTDSFWCYIVASVYTIIRCRLLWKEVVEDGGQTAPEENDN
jgi:hypothetical protein